MKRKCLIAGVGLFFIGWVSLTAVAEKQNAPERERVHVTASFYPLYFFAQEIGGDRANVQNLTPGGAEPHDYEPTPQEIARVRRSRLLIMNGGGLEPWGGQIGEIIDPKQTLLVTAGANLATHHLLENGKETIDPHVWLSPPLAKLMVETIEQGFAQVDPAHAEQYRSNAAALKAKLDALDAAYRRGLAHCKEENVITSHAAFGYLSTTYHFHQVPIARLSPDAEPSPRRLAEIADFAKRNHVKVIFFESRVSPKLSETIAAEVGAQTRVLNPIEGLADEEIAAGKNYFTEMERNLVALEAALQCQP